MDLWLQNIMGDNMKYNINRHLNIIRRNKKTTFVGLAVLAGTGIKWGLGAPAPI